MATTTIAKKPQFLDEIINTLIEANDATGASVRYIMHEVQKKINKLQPKPRNVIMKLRTAIQHGLKHGVFYQRAGRIVLNKQEIIKKIEPIFKCGVSPTHKKKILQKLKLASPSLDLSNASDDYSFWRGSVFIKSRKGSRGMKQKQKQKQKRTNKYRRNKQKKPREVKKATKKQKKEPVDNYYNADPDPEEMHNTELCNNPFCLCRLNRERDFT